MDYYIQPNQQGSGRPEETRHEIKNSIEHTHSAEKQDFTFPGAEENHLTGQPMGAPPLQSQPEEPKGPPIGGILAGVLGIFSIVAAYGWITGSWDAEHTIPTIIVVLVGGVVAFFAANSFGYTLLIIETVGSVLLWIYAAIIDFIQADSLEPV